MKKSKKNFIALIPARKGSKSIKNKNLFKILGKPLIHYTLKAAKKSKIINKIFVSSDCKKILNYSLNQSVNTIKRPKMYSKDNSTANEVVKNFFDEYPKIKKDDVIIYLQPTSPFRNHIDIDKSINLFLKNNMKPLVSVKKTDICIYKTLYIKNKLLKSFFGDNKMTYSRQNVPTSYEVNGAIYIFKVSDFLRNSRFPIEKSFPFIMSGLKNLDIDEPKDLKILRENSKIL
jgi:CMP-N,N'-diacetyllegionaminic acid synthase